MDAGVVGVMMIFQRIGARYPRKCLTNPPERDTIQKSHMRLHVIKALCRATSKTLLIRALTMDKALIKAAKLKEFRDVYVEFQWLESRPDDREHGI
jgi:hypothetical protein